MEQCALKCCVCAASVQVHMLVACTCQAARAVTRCQRLPPYLELLPECDGHLIRPLFSIPFPFIFPCKWNPSQWPPLLRTLHWLHIQARIEYKPSTLCHSFFCGYSPCLSVWPSSCLFLRSDSSAPLLIRELYTFRTWRPKHLGITHFPMPLLQPGILCLVKL